MKLPNLFLWFAGALGAVTVAAVGWQFVKATLSNEATAKPTTLPYVTAPGWSFPNPPSVFWIDNDRLIYLGGSEEEYDELIAKRLFAVRIWNWRTGEAVSFDRAAVESLCYDGNEVRYIVQRGDIVVERYGGLSALQTRALERKEHFGAGLNKRGEARHRFYCRTYKTAALGPEGNCRIPLRDGDGILDATGRACRQAEREERDRLKALPHSNPKAASPDFRFDQQLLDRPAAYFTSAAADPTLLPIASREVHISGWGIRYSEFAQAYTFRADRSTVLPWTGSWPEGVPIPFYLLRRGGVIEKSLIPYDERLQGAPADAQLSRRGLVLLSTRVQSIPEPGDAGVYLQRTSGMPIKIFSAISDEIRVSPDGCRVAIHSAFFPPQGRKNVRGRMNVLDLCGALPDGN